jgi:hypothetical protein
MTGADSISPRRAIRRPIRPTRARAGLQTSPNRSEKTVVFRHLSEDGSVRASGEPLLAAHAPIAAWPKGGEPSAAWWHQSQPRAVLAADGGPSGRPAITCPGGYGGAHLRGKQLDLGPLPGCARRGCGTRGLGRAAAASAASVRPGACSASARNSQPSVADGPWAIAMTAKSLSSWIPAIGSPISRATRSERRSSLCLATWGFSAVGTDRLEWTAFPGSPGPWPGWTANPRCGPQSHRSRRPAACHRG